MRTRLAVRAAGGHTCCVFSLTPPRGGGMLWGIGTSYSRNDTGVLWTWKRGDEVLPSAAPNDAAASRVAVVAGHARFRCMCSRLERPPQMMSRILDPGVLTEASFAKGGERQRVLLRRRVDKRKWPDRLTAR